MGRQQLNVSSSYLFQIIISRFLECMSSTARLLVVLFGMPVLSLGEESPWGRF
jgi:hypothetical protein